MAPQADIRLKHAIYAVYLLFAALSLYKHELWGDELQGWNAVKHAGGFFALITELRNDFHPAVWNTGVYLLSNFTDNPEIMKGLTFIVVGLTAFIFVYRSPFGAVATALILSGYYFLFEYTAFSRGYMCVVLFGALLCSNLSRPVSPHWKKHYLYLVLLALSHVLGIFLACGIHAAAILGISNNRSRFRHFVFGAIVVLLSFCYALPSQSAAVSPADSMGGIGRHDYWVSLQSPVRALLPMPAWWKFNFWNTQFLLDAGIDNLMARYGALALSVFFLFVCGAVLVRHRAAFILFGVSVALIMLFGLVFPLVSARYVGVIYLSLIFAMWLAWRDNSPGRRRVLYGALALQIPGGLFAVAMALQHPFSKHNETERLYSLVPDNTALVTDYEGLNHLVAAKNRPYYCINTGKSQRSYRFTKENWIKVQTKQHYKQAIGRYMDSMRVEHLFLFTTRSPVQLADAETAFFNGFRVTVIAKAEGAIEKFSNLYLYSVTRKGNVSL